MKGKLADFFIKLVAALEVAELLSTVVLDTSTGTIILLHAPLTRICSGACSQSDSLK
jgi:hypothetical protein